MAAASERGRPESAPELSPRALQDAAAAFGLLASTTRLHIVWALASEGECDVGGLAARVDGTLQAVSQHLAKLKLAGVVTSRREGRRQVYLVEDPRVVAVVRQMLAPPRSAASAPVRAHGMGA